MSVVCLKCGRKGWLRKRRTRTTSAYYGDYDYEYYYVDHSPDKPRWCYAAKDYESLPSEYKKALGNVAPEETEEELSDRELIQQYIILTKLLTRKPYKRR